MPKRNGREHRANERADRQVTAKLADIRIRIGREEHTDHGAGTSPHQEYDEQNNSEHHFVADMPAKSGPQTARD